ncbi:hypothetical protein D3C86_1509340 [compost metagenome]
MNGLKLVVPDCHTNEGVEIGFVVQKTLPVGEEVAQVLLPFWRGVDNFTRSVIRKLCSRRTADVQLRPLQRAADFYSGVGR